MKTEGNGREEIFSRAVRAGKRTYFFDVKSTRNSDLYLTITESKKRYNKNGKFYFEKHKLFLYKEDFDKFANGLQETIDFIKENNEKYGENGFEDEEPTGEQNTEEEGDDYANDETENPEDNSNSKKFTDVDFDDLNE